MASKIMKISFPLEDSDVYALLRTKSKPSKFVVEAVRFYQANKNLKRQQDEIKRNLEILVRSIIKEELSESSSKIKNIIDSTLEEALKDLNIQGLSPTPKASKASTEIGKLDVSLLEDTSSFDFSESIMSFVDDD